MQMPELQSEQNTIGEKETSSVDEDKSEDRIGGPRSPRSAPQDPPQPHI